MAGGEEKDIVAIKDGLCVRSFRERRKANVTWPRLAAKQAAVSRRFCICLVTPIVTKPGSYFMEASRSLGDHVLFLKRAGPFRDAHDGVWGRAAPI